MLLLRSQSFAYYGITAEDINGNHGVYFKEKGTAPDFVTSTGTRLGFPLASHTLPFDTSDTSKTLISLNTPSQTPPKPFRWGITCICVSLSLCSGEVYDNEDQDHILGVVQAGYYLMIVCAQVQ